MTTKKKAVKKPAAKKALPPKKDGTADKRALNPGGPPGGHPGSGRPAFMVDYKTVEKLASLDCTDREIAAFLGCSRDTITELKKNDPLYIEAVEHGLGKGNVSIRRKQWAALEDGSIAMMIWLGKQRLGQAEKAELKADVTSTELPASIDDFV